MSYGFNNDKSKFPLGSASDLPDPSKTPLEIIGDLQKQIIDNASIENGATASKAYASGDYVCFQGALCKASKAISQGDTLSIGDSENDNLTLTDAAAEFARINSNVSALLKMPLDQNVFPALFAYRGIVPNNDLNEISLVGIYMYDNSSSHAPTSYGVVLHFSNNKYKGGSNVGVWVTQIAFGTNYKTYQRSCVNLDSFTAWKEFNFV